MPRLAALMAKPLNFASPTPLAAATREVERQPGWAARGPTGDSELIQVCADPTANETNARELHALTAARHTYPDAACRLLTLTADASSITASKGVLVQPAYEWLLDTPS